jgi:hypothetical protein
MIDLDLFKWIADKHLPKDVFDAVTPHLETLIDEYEINEEASLELRHLEREDRLARFQGIRDEFLAQNDANWPAFVRQRWPEVDKFFDLSPRT